MIASGTSNGARRGIRDAGALLSEQRVRSFWRRVEKTDGCWIWKGTSKTKDGLTYGRVLIRGRQKSAQVVAFLLSGGVIPDGLVLDHLCRNTLRVRPDHLEPVTNVENIMRGDSKWAKQARQTHCNNGHALTPDNLERCELPKRKCSTCKRRRALWRKAALRVGLLPASPRSGTDGFSPR